MKQHSKVFCKKSIVLALVLLLGLQASFVNVFAANTSTEKTKTLYFYMPDDWYEKSPVSTLYASWGEVSDQIFEHMVDCEKTQYLRIFKVTVPDDVKTIVWSNTQNPLRENELSKAGLQCKTDSINCDYYEPETNSLYPDGLQSFDDMLFVPDIALQTQDSLGNKSGAGEWYYIYPNDYRILGDVNSDDELNITDATAIQKHLAKISNFSEEQLPPADFDYDGDISIKDVTQIQKSIALL